MEIKLSAAESTLSTMAKVVLVLGIISSIIVFFSACIAWDYSTFSHEIRGVDGINWAGIPSFIYCLMATLVCWSLLSVIVEISVNVRSKSNVSEDWKKEFAIAIATGQSIKAKEILYRTIFESEEFKKFLTGGNDTYHQQCIDDLNNKYAIYLKEIGEVQWKYTKPNEMMNAFK